MSVLRAQRALRSPLAWVLGVALVLRAVGLGWGLPASDGWDNDGIAPRDFLPGLIESFTPGHYFTYPPAHLALLALLTLPITAVALVRAPSFAPADVIGEVLKVPYMTSYALVARAVAVAMSLGLVYAVARIAEEVAGKRAGLCAAAVCAVNVILTYYAHTTNLDVPYLFWALWALLSLTRAIAREEPRRLRRFAVFAALSVASKDQGYALFVLGAPVALAGWALADPWPKKNLRAVGKELAIAVALGAAVLLVVDGALVNPSGFRARLAFLSGPASQPHAYYSADLAGRLRVLCDSATRFGQHYPWAFAPLVLLGIVRAARLRGEGRGEGETTRAGVRVAALVPLLAIVSFTLAFNCVARRVEHRFLMPQMVLWSVYAGLGLDALAAAGRPWRVPARALAAAAFAWAVFRCADVDANLVLDPRYDAEAWLEEHVRAGDVVEVHGNTVYLPRLPAAAHVVHVGTDPVRGRNPILGAEEKEDALGNVAARAPRFIVVSNGYAQHFLDDGRFDPLGFGRIRSAKQVATGTDADASTFFRQLLAGQLGYARAHTSTWTSSFWPRLDIHGSVSEDVWIFEKEGA
jgi:Dolichyl-phosphate-mannose-protein mannosyltransferase